MTATATHDTKRGEDARARIMALAEIPGEWASAVARWKVLNAPHLVHRRRACARPRPTFEYMLYQALLGAWPPGGRTRVCRADAGLCAEGGARGQAGDQLAQSQRGLRGRAAGPSSRAFSIRAVSAEFLDSFETLAQRVCAAGRAELAEPDHPEGHDAGRARFLSGHGILGPVAGRSRQPPAGGFCRARCRRWRRWKTPDWQHARAALAGWPI